MILEKRVSRRQICRDTGISRGTVRKILLYKCPPGYRRKAPVNRPKLGAHTHYIETQLSFDESLPTRVTSTAKSVFEKLRNQCGYEGGYSTVLKYISKRGRASQAIWKEIYDVLISLSRNEAINLLELLSRQDPSIISQATVERFFRVHSINAIKLHYSGRRSEREKAAREWMHKILQGSLSRESIENEVGNMVDVQLLLNRVHERGLAERNRALCVLAEAKGIQRTTIYKFLGISATTGRKYLEAYKIDGIDGLYRRDQNITRKADNEIIKKAVFTTLHEPPSVYGINRTTWKADDIVAVLAKKDITIGKAVLRQITKEAGFKWRKARIVLTSKDPEYREKLERIQDILRKLQTDEAFFSIDEFGPLAVKTKGGRKLVAPGERYTVPQWQKSKGCLIMTAALELSRNHVTHFYSDKKNTDEMIRMMDLLIKKYKGYKKIWLSWDAASWHMSKKLFTYIEALNTNANLTGDPTVDTAPLPAGAQFLNIIESVFSGLARGVIHNSDYRSLDEAREAIDRYFVERNDHYQRYPKRAGNKIWGDERVVSEFNESNNCKDPRYR